MISALVFSRDRPAQLDLLLQSLRERAPEIYEKTAALFRPTESRYEQGFSLCASYHPAVTFVRERDFQAQVLDWLTTSDGDLATTFCDDDVLLRPVDHTPELALDEDHRVLNFSLRLGSGAIACYPLRKPQRTPALVHRESGAWIWDWHGALSQHDWAYAGSVDGTIWRRAQLLTLIHRSKWSSPNELEDALNNACQTALLPLGACYEDQRLVGLPLNSVQDVYKPNRHAETHRAPLLTLNARFLEGRRLSLDSVIASKVDAAHCEVKLLWQPELVTA